MKKILLPLALIIAALAGFYVFKVHRTESISVVYPVKSDAVQAVYATGTVEPSVMIPIAPRQVGRMVSLLADEGEQVQKDQPLARLEDTDLAQALTQDKSRAVLAQKQYDRVAELRKGGAMSVQSLDQARTDLEAAKAAVAQLEAQISYLKLVAPADGLIIRRDGEVGQIIPANQPVFWMSCCAPFRISASVDEEDIALVKPKQKVLITADAFPGRTFKGTVTAITPKGDPVERSYRVRIGLDEDTPLMAGMTAETNIIAHESHGALLVPAAAINNGKILIVEEGVIKNVPVETGAKTDKAIEITGGIDEHTMVVPDFASMMNKEGQKISPALQTWQAR